MVGWCWGELWRVSADAPGFQKRISSLRRKTLDSLGQICRRRVAKAPGYGNKGDRLSELQTREEGSKT